MLFFTISKRAFGSKKIHESYRILQLGVQASPPEIRHKYLELIKVYHPDNKETGNQKKFIRIKNAYELIRKAPLQTANSGRQDIALGEYLDEGELYNPEALTYKSYQEDHINDPDSWVKPICFSEQSHYGRKLKVLENNFWQRLLRGDEDAHIERNIRLKNVKDDF